MFRTLRDPERTVTLYIDGVGVVAGEGETIAAVLLRQAQPWSRTTPVSGARRAPFCMMGVCFDCLAEVDGAPSVQTCLTVVQAGMTVRRQIGARSL